MYNIEFLLLWANDSFHVGNKFVTFHPQFNDLFNNEYIKLIDTNT